MNLWGAEMALTDTAIRQAKPKAKIWKMYDVDGLYLTVYQTGTKTWRVKTYLAGVEKHVTLGTYPELSLAVARHRTHEIRSQAQQGVDPAAAKQEEKIALRQQLAGTFESIANQWFDSWSKTVEESTHNQTRAILENHLFPKIGARKVGAIEPLELLEALKKIERGAGVRQAHRALRAAYFAFRYALILGLVNRNPASDLQGTLPPVVDTNYPAITDPEKLAVALKKIWDYTDLDKGGRVPYPTTAAALRFAPYVAARSDMILSATWDEFDLDKRIWSVPANRMKMKSPHIVPLAPQVIKIIEDIRPLTGHRPYVFSGRDPRKTLSGNTLNWGLRSAGIDTNTEMVLHSWRATFRTIGHEVRGYAPEWIERQLAHKVPGSLGTAYDRTQFLTQRIEMMTDWAGYLDELRQSDAANQ